MSKVEQAKICGALKKSEKKTEKLQGALKKQEQEVATLKKNVGDIQTRDSSITECMQAVSSRLLLIGKELDQERKRIANNQKERDMEIAAMNLKVSKMGKKIEEMKAKLENERASKMKLIMELTKYKVQTQQQDSVNSDKVKKQQKKKLSSSKRVSKNAKKKKDHSSVPQRAPIVRLRTTRSMSAMEKSYHHVEATSMTPVETSSHTATSSGERRKSTSAVPSTSGIGESSGHRSDSDCIVERSASSDSY